MALRNAGRLGDLRLGEAGKPVLSDQACRGQQQAFSKGASAGDMALHLRNDLGPVCIGVNAQRRRREHGDQEAGGDGSADQKPVAVGVCHGTSPEDIQSFLNSSRVARTVPLSMSRTFTIG